MEQKIVDSLIKLNKQFYQSFADQFSATRQRIQPGVVKVSDKVMNSKQILDVGCGNGSLAGYLWKMGYQGGFLGIDSSQLLIEIARSDISFSENSLFLEIDITHPDWKESLFQKMRLEPRLNLHNHFDSILCFAVLHHIPSTNLRLEILGDLMSLLAPSGVFIISVWQFLNSERLSQRILPWETIGIKHEELDKGDYLLDWRHGGYGLRYIHYFTESELVFLAELSHFRVVDSFYSDGKTGNLGLYQIWHPIQ